MKKIMKFIKVFLMLSMVFTGVLSGQAVRANEGKPKVTTTTSFLYDMTQELAGDLVDIELVIPHGEDPHLYSANPKDLEKIQNNDLLLYHGLHFEGKMVPILEERGKAVTDTFKEDKLLKMEEDSVTVTDPHFWFDIELYKEAAINAGQYLKELLPDKKEEIQKNLDQYLNQLDELKEYAEKRIQEIPQEQRYLVTPHDAFNYFSRSYGIEVVSPQGVSTESEVSSSDIEETAQFIVDHKVPAIFVESTTNPDRMKKLQEVCKAKGYEVAVVSGEDQELLSDSLAQPGQDGDTYLTMYKHNVDLIVDYLTQK